MNSTSIGISYTASAGVTLVGTDIRLNLGSTNVWAAPQYFNSNVGITGNLSIGGSVTLTSLPVGVGSTILYINSSGLLVQGALPANTSYTATNGLNLSGSAFGLGGTLTSDTYLNTSASSLFLGINNTTPSLSILSSGNVDIGTTINISKSTTIGTQSNLSVGRTLVVTNLGDTIAIAVGSTFNSSNDPGKYIYWPSGPYSSVILSVNTTSPSVAYLSSAQNPGSSQNATIYAANFNIGSNGYVGIGTANPVSAMSVNGTLSASKFASIFDYSRYYLDPGNTSNNYASLSLHGSGSIVFNAETIGGTQVSIINGSSTRFMSYYNGFGIEANIGSTAAGSTVNWSPSIFVGTSGFIGIGNTKPSAALEVSGNLNLSYGADRIIQVTSASSGTAQLDGNRLTILAGNAASTLNRTGGDLVLEAGNGGGTSGYGGNVYIAGGQPSGTGNLGNLFLGYDPATGIGGYIGIGTTNPTTRLSIGSSNDDMFSGISLSSVSTSKSYIWNDVNAKLHLDGGAGSNRDIIINGFAGNGNLGVGLTSTNARLHILGQGTSAIAIFDGSGNVGIGTTNPNYKLEVNSGNIGVIQNSGSASSAVLWLNQNNVGTSFGQWAIASRNTTGGQLGFYNFGYGTSLGTGFDAMTILGSTYNVGIGNTSPTAKLDVNNGTSTTESVINAKGSLNDFLHVNIQNTNTGASAESGFAATADNGTNTTNFMWMGINNSTFNNPQAYTVGYSGDGNILSLYNNLDIANGTAGKNIFFFTGGTADANRRMTISGTGNVGIGVTTPLYTLHVSGDALISTRLGIGSTNVLYTLNVGGTANHTDAFFSGKVAIGSTVPGPYALNVGTSTFSTSMSATKLSVGTTVFQTAYTLTVGASATFNTIHTTGFVGIGTSVPGYRLDVQSSIPTSYVMRIKNTGDTSTTSSDKGLLITLGNGTSSTGNNYFVGFGHGADVITGKIQTAAGGTQVAFTAGGSDYAEWFKILNGDPQTSPGYVMQIAANGGVTKATSGKPIGVVSDSASFIGGDSSNCPAADDGTCQTAFNNSHNLVGMIGKIGTFVSTENGPIFAGDALGPSSTPGVAAKALKAGFTIGHALEDYNQAAVARINAYINPSWYDPDLQLTSTGQVNVSYNIDPQILASLGYSGSKNEIANATYSVIDSTGSVVTKIGQFAQIATARLTAGLVSTTNLIAQNIIAETTKSKVVKTDLIAPLDDVTGTVTVDGKLSAKSITADSITASTATVSTIYADNIISKEGNFGDLMTSKISALRDQMQSVIATLATQTTLPADASPSALMAEAQSWTFDSGSSQTNITGSLSLTDSLVVGSKLTVIGDSVLGNAYVTGRFIAGEVAIKDNFIETTNTTLLVQPSGTGTVDILNHKLIIADNGEVTINGNLSVTGRITASEATVSGSLFANLINANEIKTKKLTTDEIAVATDSASAPIIAESGFAALATSSAQVSSNATAGIATLPAGKTELVINNSKITPNSIVYLTPAGSTKNQVVYLKSKFISPTPTPDANSNFTIAIDQPLATDINVNWWIIN